MADWKDLARKHEASADHYARVNYELLEVLGELETYLQGIAETARDNADYELEAIAWNALAFLAKRKGE